MGQALIHNGAALGGSVGAFLIIIGGIVFAIHRK
jgi:hypothetical protein